MKQTLFYLVLALLSCQLLLGCTEYRQEKPTGIINLSPSAPVVPDNKGTSSGGGGFADTYALEMLEIAKHSLAQMIENSSEKIFINFPAEKGQLWLANLIRNIEYKDIEISRYNRPLKFDNDLKNKKIYATRYFSSTFPYGRIWTRDGSERVRILFEVYFDILHEASHFYDIGITEKTDKLSDTWAMEFLVLHLGAEKYTCKASVEQNGKVKKIGLFLNPSTGLSYSGHLDDSDSNMVFEHESRDNGISLILIPSQNDEQEILERHFWNYIGLADHKDLVLPTIDLEKKPYMHGESLNLNFVDRPFGEWIVRPMGFPVQTSIEQNSYRMIYDEYFNPEDQNNKYEETGTSLFQKEDVYELNKVEKKISFYQETTEYNKLTMEVINKQKIKDSAVDFDCSHQFNPIVF